MPSLSIAMRRLCTWSPEQNRERCVAFFWTAPAPMVGLGGLDGCDSYASDINNHREIAGGSADGRRRRWAVVWSKVGGAKVGCR